MTPVPAAERATGPLDRLCDLLGVRRRYTASGEVHEAPEASVRAVLGELGAPLAGDGPEADDEALRAVRAGRWQRLVEPVSVAWDGEPPEVGLRLLESEAEERVEVRIVLEDGSVAERTAAPDELAWEDGGTSVEGRRYRRARLEVAGDLPPGHHDVSVRVGAREGTTRLVRAPGATWDGPGEETDGRGGPAGVDRWRSWGLFLPLHALRTTRDRGVGDLGDLAELARWTKELGGDFVATLPLLSTFVGEHGGVHDPSPYAPVSRLFWNELHLDLERAPGLDVAPGARRVLESASHRREAERLRGLERVDHRAVAAHARRVLEPLSREVAGAGAGAGIPGTLEAFVALRPEAVEYARFRAYGEHAGRPWPEWPGEARGAPLDPELSPAGRVAYHLYAQWAMDGQMEELAGGGGADLYLDLPLGCHRLGYDVWRHRDAFALGASGGAPPDAFFAGGQDWGFPPLHPLRSREDGHDYFVRSLRHLMGVSAMLRLDHVMSLHRLFWVPAGGSPAEGVYVRYPAEELWAILCLESHRHRCEVVGEDLGTVPPEVPEAMERRKARRTWVLPFEVGPAPDGDDEASGGARWSPPPARSVASLDTHDLPPFAAFWRATDLDRRVEDGHLAPDRAAAEREGRARWRRAVGGLLGVDPEAGPEEALPAALALLARSPARLVLVNLEDLWLETTPQNVPGTDGAPNWTLRARRALEEIVDDAGVLEALDLVHRIRRSPESEAEDET